MVYFLPFNFVKDAFEKNESVFFKKYSFFIKISNISGRKIKIWVFKFDAKVKNGRTNQIRNQTSNG